MSRERFAEVVRREPVDLALACLLVGAESEPDLVVADHLAVLDALASSARADVPAGASPREAAEGLRRALGERAGFAGSTEDYLDPRASMLHQVLRRRHGLPILLSVVWVEVADRLGVAAVGVGLPGHFVVCVGDPAGEHQLVDPFTGGRLVSWEEVSVRVRETTGAPLDPADVRGWAPREVLLRVLLNLLNLSERPDPSLRTAAAALAAADLALLLPEHPAWLRAARGRLRVRLGDFPGAVADLLSYAEVVAVVDEAAARSARGEARSVLARLS